MARLVCNFFPTVCNRLLWLMICFVPVFLCVADLLSGLDCIASWNCETCRGLLKIVIGQRYFLMSVGMIVFYGMGISLIWGRRRPKLAIASFAFVGLTMASVVLYKPDWGCCLVEHLNRGSLIVILASFGALCFDRLFLRCGRILCIAGVSLIGVFVYSVLPVQYDDEPTSELRKPFIAPIHVANQLAGITLPSRGKIGLPGTEPDVNEGPIKNTELEGQLEKQVARSVVDWPLGRNDEARLSIFIYKLFHFLLWVFLVSLVFSFYSREQLNRLRVKMNIFRRVSVFWGGGDLAVCIAENRQKRGDEIVVSISGKDKKSLADTCDAHRYLWIETEIDRRDDVILYANEHYFLTKDGMGNLLRAIALVKRLQEGLKAGGRLCLTHRVVKVYIRIDGLAEKVKQSAVNWAENVRKEIVPGGRRRVEVLLFEEADLVVEAFNVDMRREKGLYGGIFAFETAASLSVLSGGDGRDDFMIRESENLKMAFEKRAKCRHGVQRRQRLSGEKDGFNVVLCECDREKVVGSLIQLFKRLEKGRIFVYCRTADFAEIVKHSQGGRQSASGRRVLLETFGVQQDVVAKANIERVSSELRRRFIKEAVKSK